jgi:hypothetical protein
VSGGADPAPLSAGAQRPSLAERLRERRDEIAGASLARVRAISDPASVKDPAYAAGLREAVAAGVDYGLAALDAPWGQNLHLASVPPQLVAQARYAARSGVPLDTVLRRYFAGYTLLGDFLVKTAEEINAPASELQRALHGGATSFDHLVAAISAEYTEEVRGRSRTTEERRVAQVRMILDAELVDATDLGYELDSWHLGLIVEGRRARAAVKELAEVFDRRPLIVCPEPGTVWAWLGGRKRLASRELLKLARSTWCDQVILALGEPGEGVDGWRLSHRQAKAALSVVRLGSERQAAYADVALVAAVLQDEVLAASLPRIYLEPLRAERDDGATLRQTLRAYFTAERNASSAAADLGVSRRTVANRLRLIEEHLGRPLSSCGAELEAALRLEALAT